MVNVRIYKDSKVEFSVPTSSHVEAHEAAGQYYVRCNGQELTISILPHFIGGDLFEKKAAGPSPQQNRSKTVHNCYTFGGKIGRAIEWEIFDLIDGQLVNRGIEFFLRTAQWSVSITFAIEPSADAATFEDIVRSLSVKD